jgi:hypothetical protein
MNSHGDDRVLDRRRRPDLPENSAPPYVVSVRLPYLAVTIVSPGCMTDSPCARRGRAPDGVEHEGNVGRDSRGPAWRQRCSRPRAAR